MANSIAISTYDIWKHRMKTLVVIVRIMFVDAPAALSDVEPGGGMHAAAVS